MHRYMYLLGTCESEIFVQIESRIESGVVIYVFNADCNGSCVGLLCNSGNYPTACYVAM